MQHRSVDAHLIKVFTFLLKGVDPPFERVHFTSYNFIILKLFLDLMQKKKRSCRMFTLTLLLCHSAVVFLP